MRLVNVEFLRGPASPGGQILCSLDLLSFHVSPILTQQPENPFKAHPSMLSHTLYAWTKSMLCLRGG